MSIKRRMPRPRNWPCPVPPIRAVARWTECPQNGVGERKSRFRANRRIRNLRQPRQLLRHLRVRNPFRKLTPTQSRSCLRGRLISERHHCGIDRGSCEKFSEPAASSRCAPPGSAGPDPAGLLPFATPHLWRFVRPTTAAAAAAVVPALASALHQQGAGPA
jgi:hypothetical protein